MRKKVLYLLTLIFLSVSARAADDFLAVQFKPIVTMDGDTLIVRDLVDTDQTDIDFVKRYGDLKIDNLAPDTDKIDQSKLMSVLFGAGADVDKIRFKLGASVKLERGQKIELTSDQTIKITSAVSKAYNVPSKDITVSAARVLPAVEELALDGIKLIDVKPVDMSDLNASKVSVMLEDFDGNRSAHTMTFKLKVETTVVSATADLASGDTVTEATYVAGRSPVSALKGRLVGLSDIKDKPIKAITSIKKGDILTADMVRATEIVKQGSPVTISYKTSILNVKAQGTLLQGSEIGSTVTVENTDSKRTITGILISKDMVEVANASEH